MSVPNPYPRVIYLSGLAILAIGLPVSTFLMSIGQFIMLGGLLLDGKWLEKLCRFWKNKMAVLVASVLILHLLGLLYTKDYDYAFHDIRIKTPLLVLPLFITCTEPLTKRLFNWLLFIFVGSVTVGTFICTGIYLEVFPTRHVQIDSRSISVFISHIRFSMMITFSILICAYYFYQETSFLFKFLLATLAIWLITFLGILNSLTGIVLLIILVFVFIVHGIFNSKNKQIKTISTLSFFVVVAGIGLYINSLVKETGLYKSAGQKVDASTLDQRTALGNKYEHYPDRLDIENGYPVWIYLCTPEMEQAWNERSKLNCQDKNKKGEDVRFTLMRYLTSKGLRKDAAGVHALSGEEIKAIENGIADVNYMGKSQLSIRLMESIWEYRYYTWGGSPNGHSIIMRLEFWKAAVAIIKKHPVAGVGTGDVNQAFLNQYREMNSALGVDYYLRSHNQFLSITVAFGFVGLIWFLFALVYPMIRYKMTFDYFYAVFFMILFLSMFTEDTLETQAGVTFYAFFNSILLFARPWIKTEIQKINLYL